MTTKVHVSLVKDTDTQMLMYKVKVYSKVRKGLIAQNDIFAGLSRMEYRVMVAAAACAEHQNEKYGDIHDPDKVAHAAREAFLEVQQMMKANEKQHGSTTTT